MALSIWKMPTMRSSVPAYKGEPLAANWRGPDSHFAIAIMTGMSAKYDWTWAATLALGFGLETTVVVVTVVVAEATVCASAIGITGMRMLEPQSIKQSAITRATLGMRTTM